jgi:type II secretory pathway component PulF
MFHILVADDDQSTRRLFKAVLEDILSGVEAGEFMYTTMEYYEDIFPYIYINMIKVGELSGSLEKSLERSLEKKPLTFSIVFLNELLIFFS